MDAAVTTYRTFTTPEVLCRRGGSAVLMWAGNLPLAIGCAAVGLAIVAVSFVMAQDLANDEAGAAFVGGSLVGSFGVLLLAVASGVLYSLCTCKLTCSPEGLHLRRHFRDRLVPWNQIRAVSWNRIEDVEDAGSSTFLVVSLEDGHRVAHWDPGYGGAWRDETLNTIEQWRHHYAVGS